MFRIKTSQSTYLAIGNSRKQAKKERKRTACGINYLNQLSISFANDRVNKVQGLVDIFFFFLNFRFIFNLTLFWQRETKKNIIILFFSFSFSPSDETELKNHWEKNLICWKLIFSDCFFFFLLPHSSLLFPFLLLLATESVYF